MKLSWRRRISRRTIVAFGLFISCSLPFSGLPAGRQARADTVLADGGTSCSGCSGSALAMAINDAFNEMFRYLRTLADSSVDGHPLWIPYEEGEPPLPVHVRTWD